MRQDLKHVMPEQAVAGTGGDADAQTMAVARGITVDSPSKRPQLSSSRCSKKADPGPSVQRQGTSDPDERGRHVSRSAGQRHERR